MVIRGVEHCPKALGIHSFLALIPSAYFVHPIESEHVSTRNMRTSLKHVSTALWTFFHYRE